MRIIKKFLLVIGVLLAAILAYLTIGWTRPADSMTWGVSFSKAQAESLGLDWKQTYLALLDDLGISNLRIGSYWTETEPEPGRYEFADLDFMITQAATRGRKVILTLGLRQPRWPECHIPAWAKKLSYEEQQPLIEKHIRHVVERYKSEPAVIAWQVENEYFVKWFGNCPVGQQEFLAQEIALVKSSDSRPVIITDSGELSLWLTASRYGDTFGTTMYRRVRGSFGPATWPWPAVYYKRLASLVQLVTGRKTVVIAELQGEPWAKKTLREDSMDEHFETMSLGQFRSNIAYARRSGFDTAYLWGAEWWYYMKQDRGVPDYWEEARKLWRE